jgi:flagellar hook-basal body complex protein FliE
MDKLFVPESVLELTPDMQFRAQLQSLDGSEVMDCRLWHRDQSGTWTPDSNAMAIDCHNLIQLQKRREHVMTENKRKFDQALTDIQTAFEQALANAKNAADRARKHAHEKSQRGLEDASEVSERVSQEYNLLANLILMTTESIIGQAANGS